MPRYVLLYHQCPPNYERPSHWDLMLETGDVLTTWALRQLPRDWQAAHLQSVATDVNCPPIAPGNSVAAEQLKDHRIDYLELEGELSRNRGRVTRIAAGTYERVSLSSESCEIALAGDLMGKLVIRQTDPGQSNWELVYASLG